MLKRHIVYISGLGDAFDPLRKLGLTLWRRPGVKVSHVPMHWLNPNESYEQKLARIKVVAEKYQDYEVVYVGESAGGPMAIASLRRNGPNGAKVVTICGMNQGAANVKDSLYLRNHAFKDAMNEVDRIVPTLSQAEEAVMMTLYSSMDKTVCPRNTLLSGVEAYDLRTPQHILTILTVLFWRYRLILKFTS